MTRDSTEHGVDEELRDILIAISVVAKRLARKLEANQPQTASQTDEEVKNGKNEGTVNDS